MPALTTWSASPAAVRRAVLLLAATVVLRLLVAAIVPLVPDETYYWEWSRHLAAGYFDHPPLIAWLIRAGTTVAGDTPLGVRLVPVIAGFGGGLAVLALARRLGGNQSAWHAAVLDAALPLAGLGLVLATPDAPLLIGCAVVLWAIDHAVEHDGGHPAWWGVAGVALGVAMCAKYTAVLIPVAVALSCVLSPALRRQFRRPGPYLACAVALVVFMPVVLWNARHDWVSFRFQLHHGLGGVSGSAVGRELLLLSGQAALMSPVLFVLFVIAVMEAAARRDRPRPFVLAVVALFIWCCFGLSAIRRPVEPNWPAVASLPALVLLAAGSPTPGRRRWERVGVVLGGTLIVVAYVALTQRWVTLPGRADPIGQAYGWDELAAAVQREGAAADPTARRHWVAADRYQDASELAFHLDGHPTVFSLNLAGRRNQYDLWPALGDSIRLGDGVTLVLDAVPDWPAPLDRLAPHFGTVVRGTLVELHHGTRVVARRRLWHLLGLTQPL